MFAGSRRSAFEMSDAMKQLYNLPSGLHGDIDDPTRDTRVASNYGGRPGPRAEHPQRNPRPERSPYDIDPTARSG